MANQELRDNWVKEKLSGLTGQILDIGAGEQPYKESCRHLFYMPHESPKPYTAKGNGEALQNEEWNYKKPLLESDICSIPLISGALDNVLCTEVLEHVSNPVGAVKEMARILKPGGKLILTAPFCSLVHQAPFYFYSGFSRYWYEKFLPENGLEILELISNGNFFEWLAQEIDRSPLIGERYAELFEHKTELAGWKTETLRSLFERVGMACSKSSEILCFGYCVFAERMAA